MARWLRILAVASFISAASQNSAARAEASATPLATRGPAHTLVATISSAPAGEVPLHLPEGFRAELLVEGLQNPRKIAVLPSGDLLVTDYGVGTVWRVPMSQDGKPSTPVPWVSMLHKPHGITYHDGRVYVATSDEISAFEVTSAGSAGAASIPVRPISFNDVPLKEGVFWSRDVLFARDGKRFYVAVGATTNVRERDPPGHAAILEYDVGSQSPRLFATGLRNPISMALRPGGDDIWTSVAERDGLGDELVPDFVTRVRRGAFYGWPYFFIGAHEEPRLAGRRPDLASSVVVPDVILPAHVTPTGLTFYDGEQFPERFRGGLFVALHGSWNRPTLLGYKVVFIPFRKGMPAGPPEDFLTGFIQDAAAGQVYGRPVAPVVWRDGSLLITDDGAGRIWRVRWVGKSN